MAAGSGKNKPPESKGDKSKKKQNSAVGKADRLRREHEAKIATLQNAQADSERKAELLQGNREDVETAIQIVRSAVAQAVHWAELERTIEDQRRAGNAIARMISKLNLAHNRITLLLEDDTQEVSDEEDDDDDDDESLSGSDDGKRRVRRVEVEVDISLSANANANNYFAERRTVADRVAQSREAAETALRPLLKAAEREEQKQIRRERIQSGQPRSGGVGLATARRLWFEKFVWFISAERYLVLCGRDGSQNELLVRHYLHPGDVFVHADADGAQCCIVKNHTPNVEVPLSTLAQAGCTIIANSTLWEMGKKQSPWWVYHNQVSKTASGDALRLNVRGKKNFLPPQPLIMGIGILFHAPDAAKAAAASSESLQPSTPSDEQQQPQQSGRAGRSAGGSRRGAGGVERPEMFLNLDMEKYGLVQHAYNETFDRVSFDPTCEKDDNGPSPPPSDALSTTEENKSRSGADRDSSSLALSDGSNEGRGESASNKKRMSAKERRMVRKQTRPDGAEESAQEASSSSTTTNRRSTQRQRGQGTQPAAGEGKEGESDPTTNGTSAAEGNSGEADDKADTASVATSTGATLRRVRSDYDPTEIDALVGTAGEADISFAVPMCAPYAALVGLGCKFRAQLIPGNNKRGKVAPQVQRQFSVQSNATATEKAAIAAIDVGVLTTALINAVKISASTSDGGSAEQEGEKGVKDGKGKKAEKPAKGKGK